MNHVDPQMPPIFKTHGGKAYLCRWLIGLLPPKCHEVVDLCVGGANIVGNADPSCFSCETWNDRNSARINVYRIMASQRAKELIFLLEKVRYVDAVFEEMRDTKEIEPEMGSLTWAMQTIIVNRMSRGGFGKVFSWSDRMRGPKGEKNFGDVVAWDNMVKSLGRWHERMRGRNFTASELDARVVASWKRAGGNVLIFDPPYLTTTRTSPTAYGSCEVVMPTVIKPEWGIYQAMPEPKDDVEWHEQCAKILNEAKGHVLVCGYPSPEYDEWYDGWITLQVDMPNHSSQQRVKERRVEKVWLNYNPETYEMVKK